MAQLFARTHGPLRPVVERGLREFLKCGLAQHGFGRAFCETCRATYVVPFSCREEDDGLGRWVQDTA